MTLLDTTGTRALRLPAGAARAVHLVADPRRAGPGHPYFAAHRWRTEQRAALATDALRVRLEDLREDPHGQLALLREALGAEPQLALPPPPAALPRVQVALVEAVAGREMEDLGYPLQTSPEEREGLLPVPSLRRLGYALGDLLRGRLPALPPRRPRSHAGVTVWFTGLSGAGKSTLCRAVEERLRRRGCRVEVLDGDEVRQNLSRGLGFSRADRDENIRRLGYVARLLTRQGVAVLVAAISPYREVRDEVRRSVGEFVEVFVDAPLEVCERRDVKGLYARARAGEIPMFTGVSDPYEPPGRPEVACRTERETLEQSARRVLNWLEEFYGL